MKHFLLIFDFVVLIAGFLNAGGIMVQAVKLYRIKDPKGFSVTMFLIFLFIQLTLALNGFRHHDAWQATGMFLSMIPTMWIIGAIKVYERKASA